MLDADAKLEEKSELILTNYTQHYFMKEDNTRYAPLGTKEGKKKYLDESKSIYFSPLEAKSKVSKLLHFSLLYSASLFLFSFTIQK